ncbi:transcriptional regulator, TetR family [Alkalicoccus daliensis]|uniref:Transcriptional regulator, TetR family n=1 Tax=Alkalicoccus daliensis TaxID=745820 RepID=A0A1H0EUK6_9BACI|nr:transcriptional regulator, TetR family [Alkalicoccus daliensis]
MFQKQGMQNTSIENITSACGISKGAFYKYFHSKEEMVLALVEKYYAELFAPVSEKADPLKKLEQRIQKEFDQAVAYRSFIFELTLAFPPGSSSSVVAYLEKQHDSLFQWRKDALLEAFGARGEEMAEDLLVLADGMIHGYLRLMIWRNQELPIDILSRFIVEALQAVVNKEGKIRSVLPALKTPAASLSQLQNELIKLQLQKKEASETAALILEEWKTETPRSILVDALLKHLEDQTNQSNEVIALRIKWAQWKGEQQ